MLSRRDILAGAAIAPVLATPMAKALARSAATPEIMSPLAEAAASAWLYGLPLIEMAMSRANTLRSIPQNTVLHAQGLTTPQTQSVTTPNNDTLYSRAWLDLSQGPVTVTIPKAGDRYLSVALMDMFSNNFSILGTRTTGGDGGTFRVVGPADPTTGTEVIRAPTNSVWLLLRLFVRDPADVPAASTIQRQLTVDGPTSAAPPDVVDRSAPWNSYFGSVARLIRSNTPPATDDALFDVARPLGLNAAGHFDAAAFSRAEVTEIEKGVRAAKQRLSQTRQGAIVDGWKYPKTNLGDFGQDYLYRAQVALGGLAALPRNEAMYMRPVDQKGAVPLSSDTTYAMHFDRDNLPPVDAFWSMTSYVATEDGQYRLFENPVDRYAISDRTTGLRYDADGGLTIWMSREEPGPDRRANWLPLPRQGSFAPVMRAYLPQTQLVEGVYRLPPLETVS